jgi:hypothetical protein
MPGVVVLVRRGGPLGAERTGRSRRAQPSTDGAPISFGLWQGASQHVDRMGPVGVQSNGKIVVKNGADATTDSANPRATLR